MPLTFIPPPQPKCDAYFRNSVRNSMPQAISDFEMESTMITTLDYDYSMLDGGVRKDNSSNQLFPVSLPQIPSTKPDASSGVPSSPGMDTSAPLLEPEFYFGDILGDDGIPPQALPNMSKNDDLEVAMAEKSILFSNRVAITNEELSQGESVHQGSIPSLGTGFQTCAPFAAPCTKHSTTIHANSMMRDENVLSSSSFLSHAGSLHRREGNRSQKEIIVNNSLAPLNCGEGESIVNCDENSFSDSEPYGSDVGTAENDIETEINSPLSGTSLSDNQGITSHPDLYENLTDEIQRTVDRLREKISAMPRRKLRESLARTVSLEDVEPLMFINRDELAHMLGLGVTTWKTFMHSLGVPRWPARALKSLQGKEKKLTEKKIEANKRGDVESVLKIERELVKLRTTNIRRKKNIHNNAKLRVATVEMKK